MSGNLTKWLIASKYINTSIYSSAAYVSAGLFEREDQQGCYLNFEMKLSRWCTNINVLVIFPFPSVTTLAQGQLNAETLLGSDPLA